MYRYTWSSKNKSPLRQMEEQHKNMQDVCNELGIKSLRLKIEKRVLQRIGHIMRMDDSRLVKNVTLGWMEDFERYDKIQERKRKTMLYWKKLVREAGIDYTTLGEKCTDRKVWKAIVNKRVKEIDEFEKRRANRYENEKRSSRNSPVPEDDLQILSRRMFK